MGRADKTAISWVKCGLLNTDEAIKTSRTLHYFQYRCIHYYGQIGFLIRISKYQPEFTWNATIYTVVQRPLTVKAVNFDRTTKDVILFRGRISNAFHGHRNSTKNAKIRNVPSGWY